MVSLKNNKIKEQLNIKLCKIHNDKNKTEIQSKLLTYKSPNCADSFYILKSKKCRKKKNKSSQTSLELSKTKYEILSRRYSSILSKELIREFSNESAIINWLSGEGIKVKKLDLQKYLIKNKELTLVQLLIFANKKRVKIGLNPLYLEELGQVPSIDEEDNDNDDENNPISDDAF